MYCPAVLTHVDGLAVALRSCFTTQSCSSSTTFLRGRCVSIIVPFLCFFFAIVSFDSQSADDSGGHAVLVGAQALPQARGLRSFQRNAPAPPSACQVCTQFHIHSPLSLASHTLMRTGDAHGLHCRCCKSAGAGVPAQRFDTIRV